MDEVAKREFLSTMKNDSFQTIVVCLTPPYLVSFIPGFWRMANDRLSTKQLPP
jgi:hypothetical protein